MVKMTQPKLYTRGSKLWVRFSIDSQVIKQSLNIDDNKANRKFATTQLIPQILFKVHSGEFFENTIVPNVKDMIDTSLKMHKNRRKHLTNLGYESVFRLYVIPTFGKRKIDTIKASELALWQNELIVKLAPKTVARIRTIFYGLFEDALKDEFINKNPFVLVSLPKLEVLRKVNPFSKDEIFKILDTVDDNFRCYFAIGFFTGMRTGEITGLKWEDIDLNNKTIKIRRTRNKGIESTPKTISSVRDINILDVLLPYLKEHYKNTYHHEYLFNTRKSKPFYSATQIADKYWYPTLKDLELEYRNLYQMRHTFASLMIASGEDVLWVANMLGHKSANITLQVYAKYTKNDKKQRATFLLKDCA